MIKYFAKHPTAGNLMMMLFLLLGAFALANIRRESLPDFRIESLVITAAYPGATAGEVEEAVAAPIEEALEAVGNINSIRTTAMEGGVSIIVEMTEGADWQTFYNDVKTEVESITTFPGELERLTLRPLNRTDEVFSLAVYGDMSPQDLNAYCEELRDKLAFSSAGAQATVNGFSQREFRIAVHPAALRAYNLSVVDIAAIIRNQNADLPSGTLQTGGQDIKLRFSDRRTSVEELADIRILHSASGNELTLGDIATITDRFERDEDKILFNGRRAGVISVAKSRTADSLTIYGRALAALEKEMAAAPEGVHFTITRDMASTIRERLDMIYRNAFEGFLLVFAALWLFLNIRLSFWVAVGLPISFLGGIFVMHLMGLSLNMISTFSLLIALGLLMDDAIVIAENVAAHLARGESGFDAAVNGTREVARGVISSFLTTACVFVPLMFLSGMLGKILYVIPLVLVIVLTVSLFEAFLILPGHLAHSFHKGAPTPGRARAAIDRTMDAVRFRLVTRLTSWLLTWRYALLAFVFALFAVSVTMFLSGRLKFVVFPAVDGDTVTVRVQLPPGTPLAESERAAAQLQAAAGRVNDRFKGLQPGGADLVRSVSVYFAVNSGVADSGPHLFTVYADLLPGNKRTVSVSEALAAWREEADDIPGAISVIFEDSVMRPGGRPIEIRLSGADLGELQVVSEKLRVRLAEFAGVFDIADDLIPGKPEVVMSMRTGSLKLGLTAFDIARQLRAAYQGEKADELQIGRSNYRYNVRLVDEPDDNLMNFDNFLVLAGGGHVPLTMVVNAEYSRSPSVIKRYDGRRTVTVSAEIDSDAANAMEIIAALNAGFFRDLAREHPGVAVAFGGQRQATRETGGSVAFAFLVGVVGVFILLSLQFGTYLEPLIIMATIPLAIIGAIWGHILYGVPFNIQSLIGVVSISGIVVNDSILMLEFIKRRERKGEPSREAAQRASSDRFRAVMLTSLTTVAGLLPIMMETSLQAQMLIPIAISIVFGLLTSTLMVLFVTPAMYTIALDYRKWVDS